MKKQLLPLPEGFAVYAEAILNRAHHKTPALPIASQEEALMKMRSKGLYIRMDESSTRSLEHPASYPAK